MNIKAVCSEKLSVAEAVQEVGRQLNDFDTRMLVFFASSNYDPESVSAAMKERFASATVLGCSTAGEIISGQMLKNSIVALAFNSKAISEKLNC
jgi:hypothetical protein